jgi:hypothetical protein
MFPRPAQRQARLSTAALAPLLTAGENEIVVQLG